MLEHSDRRDMAERIMILEKQLPDEKRQRYEAIKKQQAIERNRAEKILDERLKTIVLP